MGCFGDRKSLAVMTSISACASFAFLSIAIGTDYWLHATERIIDSNQTVTLMTSHNGLWKKCTIDGRNFSSIKIVKYSASGAAQR